MIETILVSLMLVLWLTFQISFIKSMRKLINSETHLQSYQPKHKIKLGHANVPFLYFLKTSEAKGIPTFSGGIEMEH